MNEEIWNKNFFPITSVSKEDILQCYEGLEGTEQLTKVKCCLENMTPNDMDYLATKMENAYCNNGYWTDLKINFEGFFLDDFEENKIVDKK